MRKKENKDKKGLKVSKNKIEGKHYQMDCVNNGQITTTIGR
jgi:hypothetical protein